MYLSAVPLPSPLAFLRPPWPAGTETGHPWATTPDSRIHLFPRGSQAMVAAARGVAKDPGQPVCFFPAYFCESSLRPLRQAGARIVFYRVTREIQPDWDNVRRRAGDVRPDLFVLVHTFGYVKDATEARRFAEQIGCVVLEDGAHVLRPVGNMGRDGSLVLYSPHKLLPLPPVSLLSVPRALAGRIDHSHPVAWRRRDWIWLGKRFVQRGFVTFGGLGLRARPRPGGFESQDTDILPGADHANEISRLGRYLLGCQQGSISAVARRRKKNFDFLADALRSLSAVNIPEPFAAWPQETVPYALPLFVDAAKTSQVYSSLWQRGIPAQTWPDLPAEVIRRVKEYPEACRWRRSLLLLPVHQSLSFRQLKAIVTGVRGVLPGGHTVFPALGSGLHKTHTRTLLMRDRTRDNHPAGRNIR